MFSRVEADVLCSHELQFLIGYTTAGVGEDEPNCLLTFQFRKIHWQGGQLKTVARFQGKNPPERLEIGGMRTAMRTCSDGEKEPRDCPFAMGTLTDHRIRVWVDGAAPIVEIERGGTRFFGLLTRLWKALECPAWYDRLLRVHCWYACHSGWL